MRRTYTYTYYKKKKPKRKANARMILAFSACLAVIFLLARLNAGLAPSRKYVLVGGGETYYLLELARFDDRLSAEIYAETVRAKGGGGTVREDGGFRVFAACYLSEGDARAVAGGLNAGGEKVGVYRVTVSPAEVKKEGSRAAVAAVFDLMDRTVSHLYEISLGLDTRMLSARAAELEIASLAAGFSERVAALSFGGDYAGELAQALAEDTAGILAALGELSPATSGAVRACTMEAVFLFEKFSRAL